MDSFYVMERTEDGPWITDIEYKHVECGRCGFRPMARIGSFAVRFKTKRSLTDFAYTSDGFLIRKTVADHLADAHISGWRPGLVTVTTVPRLRDLDARYYELVIIGHTREYAQRVGLELEEECAECGYRKFRRPQEGLIIPEECWDRSDIFVIDELPGIRVVTERFRQVVGQHQHTGISFEPVSEWVDPIAWLEEGMRASAASKKRSLQT